MSTLKRSPLAVVADALTIFRGLGVLATLLGMYLAGIRSYTWLFAVLCAAWFTDGIDGDMARRANQQSIVGKYEIIADTLMLIWVVGYILAAFSLGWIEKVLICLWIFLASASIYGTVRHHALSFLFVTEPPAAFGITFSIFGYLLAIKIIPHFRLMMPEVLICISGLLAAVFTHRIILRAIERVVTRGLPLGEDLRGVFKNL